MASTLDSPPVARTLDVETLVQQAWKGEVRVPHFQRDFRWGWEDVRRLFDSIVKGYPVGSLLLWQRSARAGAVHLGAITVDAQASDRAYWVVDGQQRLTSLANALHPDGSHDARFGLSYDLRKDEFMKPPATFDPFVVPLPVLFDLQKILKWFSENHAVADYLDKATNITKRLRQYQVPAYLVQSDDAKVLQDIFDRMNNYGKRLSRAEVFTALNAGDEQLIDGALTLEGIARNIDADLSFGLIDNDTVLACVLARRGPEIRRDIRKEFENDEEGLNAAYEAGERAMFEAVRFLQNDVGVPHYSLLAYRYLLVVLTRVFATLPKIDHRNLTLLRRWYWQGAVVGPEKFKGGTPNAARILCAKVVNGEVSQSVQRLLEAVATREARIPNAKKFSSSDASSKMLLCALWSLGPRDPLSGRTYTHEDLASAVVDSRTAQPAVRHLIPRATVPIEMRPWAANRVLMPGLSVDQAELQEMLTQAPLDLETSAWEDVLGSHLLSDAIDAYIPGGDVGQFLDARQAAVEKALGDFFRSACEWDFENTPPLSTFDLDDDD